MASASRPFVVVVTGSECTGKTTLAAELAAAFDASRSPEFVRSYVDAKRAPLDASDVEPIAAGQLAVERAAEHHAASRQARFVVRDTDLASTTVYARHYYGSCPEWIEAAARRRAGDLVRAPSAGSGGRRYNRPDREIGLTRASAVLDRPGLLHCGALGPPS